MQPRILLRTHYQAAEPRLVIAVVTRCSSATRSSDEDVLALSLRSWARKNGYDISTPGAVYAVGNARHLGLITNANHWSPAGIAFAFYDRLRPPGEGPVGSRLTPFEERLYLNVYMRGAGALAVKFARWLIAHGQTTDDELREKSIIESLLAEALDEYLYLAIDVSDRVSIRKEKERIGRADYAASTKRHKRYPLLKTLERLNLLEQSVGSDSSLVIKPDREGRLRALANTVPDVRTLENLIRDDTLRQALDVGLREYTRLDLGTGENPTVLLARAYAYAMELGLQACPLSFLNDVLCAAFPSSPTEGSPKSTSLLEPLHRSNPGEVRFHVDRRGQRAFVILSKAALAGLAA